MKLYLGCGPGPLHRQHAAIMGNPDEWTFVDLYVKEPNVKNWDATKLDEVKDNSVDSIYASHLLEHFSHTQISEILKCWYTKLAPGGKLILNVPDLAWISEQILKYDNDQFIDGYFHEWTGEHGLLSVIYGSHFHDGEYHKGGFVRKSLAELLVGAGFKNIFITKKYEAHDMGCLLASAEK